MTKLRSTAIVFAIAMSVTTGFAGGAMAAERPTAGGSLTTGQEELPPGWCYSQLIGTYECKFKVKFPWPPGW